MERSLIQFMQIYPTCVYKIKRWHDCQRPVQRIWIKATIDQVRYHVYQFVTCLI